MAFVICIGAQSAGIALTRKAPETALSLFPLNGLAQEELAIGVFRSVAADLVSAEVGNPMAERWALEAYQKEPLTPEAHAILALAEQDEEARSEIVSLVSALNRRNTTLQAVVLQEQVAQQDYPGTVATLDRILRVRPSRSAELFPSLLPLFARDGAVDEFERILDGTSPWHERFFRFALKEPAALTNLLELRKRVPFDDQHLDQTLLVNLVAQGELDAAYEFYQRLGVDSADDDHGPLDWKSTFAPFEWAFSDRAGFRAQPSLSGEELEISARPGEGGVVARRLIKTPNSPFKIEFEHSIDSPQVLRDIDILLRCGGAEGAPLLDRDLAKHGDGFEISSPPKSCRFIEIIIEARAWSGRSPLNAEIEAIRIRD
ncbi:hypothetical protein [Qipengyuania sp. 902]|uniref:hypothetical protein n=1 Tax=Qipengyuania sp. 902 TaxID=3417565 RepID=UPI003EB7D381